VKELLLYVARNLVNDPDAVTVTEVETDEQLLLELRVADADVGKVIGRQGRVAREIRTLVRSASQHGGKKVVVEIIG